MLLSNMELIATAPGGVAKLREFILTLAVQGKLVPQDPADEPAGVLLQKIRAEKDRLIAEGKIRRDKPLAVIAEEDRPFELPVVWEWVRFGEVLDFQGGGQPPKSNFSEIPLPDYVQLIQIRDLGDKPQPVYIPRKLASKFCTTSDVMVGRYGASVGKVFWGKDGAYNVALVKMVDEHQVFDRRFLFQLLLSPIGQSLFAGISRSAQDGFNKNDIEAKLIPLAPLAEQSRIVTRVEELMRLCDALEAKGRLEAAQHAQLVSTLLGTLTANDTPDELAANWQRVAQHFDLLLDRPAAIDALEQTLLQLAVRGLLVPQDPTDEPASVLLQKIRTEKDRLIAAGQIKRDKPLSPIDDEEKPFELPVGWEWVRLGVAAKKITDGTHHSPANFPNGDFMYLSAKNIKPWGIDLSSATFVPKAVHEEIFARCDPEFGDILYIKDGATTGVLTVNTLREPFSLLSSVGVIKPSCGLTSDYMALVMQSPFFYQAMRDGMSGVAITRVTLSKLADAKFPLPPLAEQSRIVTRVTALRRLCTDLRQRLKAAQVSQSHLAQALVESSNAL